MAKTLAGTGATMLWREYSRVTWYRSIRYCRSASSAKAENVFDMIAITRFSLGQPRKGVGKGVSEEGGWRKRDGQEGGGHE
eukprot:1810596-Rhodomonas_salina.1